MNEYISIAFLCYLAIFGMAGYFLWRAYRVGVKKEFRLIKKLNGQSLNNRQRIVLAFAIMELLTGIALILFLIAVPMFAIPMRIWPAFIVVIGTTRQLRILKFVQQNEH
ncbi:hypothetical protein [Methylotenera mobilis]|uniref:Transmembrane protein n=1 Tax=Methylotenera mobilis (strain JLW8 / ATCC BAA-1282 / DSM 17540) TaxID=583345 RepID=C6WUS8_METML|nr:hypothetical protein [Methylotenera mobilis]ACT47677.1 hypothetical protein Mmol_0767 [Methylotenera mobilis JLW8]